MAADISDGSRRPWTVVALVLLIFVGEIVGVWTAEGSTDLAITLLLGVAFGFLFAWGLWRGRDWARFWWLILVYFALLMTTVGVLGWAGDYQPWQITISYVQLLGSLWLLHHRETRLWCQDVSRSDPSVANRSDTQT